MSAKTTENTTQTRFEQSTIDQLRRRADEKRSDEAGFGGIAQFFLDCPADADVDELAELYEVWKAETGRNPIAKWSRDVGGSE